MKDPYPVRELRSAIVVKTKSNDGFFESETLKKNHPLRIWIPPIRIKWFSKSTLKFYESAVVEVFDPKAEYDGCSDKSGRVFEFIPLEFVQVVNFKFKSWLLFTKISKKRTM